MGGLHPHIVGAKHLHDALQPGLAVLRLSDCAMQSRLQQNTLGEIQVVERRSPATTGRSTFGNRQGSDCASQKRCTGRPVRGRRLRRSRRTPAPRQPCVQLRLPGLGRAAQLPHVQLPGAITLNIMRREERRRGAVGAHVVVLVGKELLQYLEHARRVPPDPRPASRWWRSAASNPSPRAPAR